MVLCFFFFLSLIFNCKVSGTKQMENYIYPGLTFFPSKYVEKKEKYEKEWLKWWIMEYKVGKKWKKKKMYWINGLKVPKSHRIVGIRNLGEVSWNDRRQSGEWDACNWNHGWRVQLLSVTNILGFQAIVCITFTQLCCCGWKVVTGNT